MEPQETLPPQQHPSHKAWETWKRAPTPSNLSGVLKTLAPTIDSSVARHPNVNAGVLQGEAKRLAIMGVKSYDPASGASLPSHVFNHLLPLGRHSQELTRIVAQPRGAREDGARYFKGMNDFKEENNRDPNDDEIRDMFGLDKRGLERLHRVTRFEFPEGGLENMPEMEKESPRTSLWADYVYHDLDPMGKSIMDHKMGRNGRKVLSSDEIAQKLGIHVTYVNRRASKIAQSILDGINSGKQEATDG